MLKNLIDPSVICQFRNKLETYKDYEKYLENYKSATRSSDERQEQSEENENETSEMKLYKIRKMVSDLIVPEKQTKAVNYKRLRELK